MMEFLATNFNLSTIIVSIIVGSAASIVMAVIVVIVTVVTGAIIGLIVRATRGEMELICDDDTDFVRTEKPADA